MIKTHKRVGSSVNFLYPTHGKMNILRKVCGTVLEKGVGPGGPYLTIQETNGKIRSMSTKKIVEKL